MAVSNIVRLALAGSLLVCSIIVMSLSAKLVHDGIAFNDYRNEAINQSNSVNDFDLSNFNRDDPTDSNTVFSGRMAKRAIINYGYLIPVWPVAACALDLAVAIISLAVSAGLIALSFISASISLLVSTIVLGVLSVLWLVAMAYSAHTFEKFGFFIDVDVNVSILSQAKADFAFTVLAWLISMGLLALSAFFLIKGNKGEEQPAPPVAEGGAPVQQPYDATHGHTAANPEGHHFGGGIPQPNEKPHQPPMNVPV